MKKETILKLEKYFGFLHDENKILELGQEDAKLLPLKELMRDFLNALELYANKQLKEKMNLWEEEFQQQAQETGGSAAPKAEEPAIPHAVLQELFLPNESYEALIQSPTRGNDLAILNPPNEFEWTNESCTFELGNTPNEHLNYAIENNRQQLIKQGSSAISKNQIIVTFNVQNELPGRYYIKLFSEEAFSLRSFFIQKNALK